MNQTELLESISLLRVVDHAAEEDFERLAGAIRETAAGQALTFASLGRRLYRPTWDLQKRLHAWRVAGAIGDVVLLVEHEPVYTIGKNAGEQHLLARRPADAEVVHVDRGGDITYHGPGQLVGYPIINLREHNPSVTWLMRGLEATIMEALSSYGIGAGTKEGLTGVWIGERKVAALGVRLSRWTSTHGFAINVSVPKRYFDGIVPCGLLEYGVANLNEHLPTPTDVWELGGRMSIALTRMLEERIGQVSRLY